VSCLRYRPTDSQPVNSWGELDLCLKRQAKLIECIAAQLQQQKLNGSVVLASSLASQGITSNQTLDYHAAKSGIDILVKYMAVKYGSTGIRFNAIAPIFYNKNSSGDDIESDSGRQAVLCSKIPLGRLATPRDIANIIAFLTGNESEYVTGQTIVVDGGLSCRLHEDLALGVFCGEHG
jgi:NAD(P)-dependent dehydrogenase (short-subunit alcohol dehydrogenase family)